MMKIYKPLRILIIEDDEILLEVLIRALRKIFPACAIDRSMLGEEAMKLVCERYPVRGERYDLIVSDIFLPGKLSGIQLWESCENLYPGMPCLLISGIDERELEQAAGRNSIRPMFLPKPFSQEVFRKTVEDILENGKSKGWSISNESGNEKRS